MALNPNYILASDLMGVFVDKDSGEPLSGGQIWLYKDNDRNALKYAYKLSGSPPYESPPAANASYTVLPNPIVLASDGTYQDANGNSIVPYWYPYDSAGNIELYYVVCYSAGGVLQFTRVAWPNFTSDDLSELDETNFVPNGQFLAHNNSPNSTTLGADTIKYIAQGGWTTEVTTAGGGTYSATFTRVPSGLSWTKDFPRYLCNWICTTPGAKSRRDLCLRWNDVNQFEGAASGDRGSQTYTFFFAAQAASSAVDVQIIVRKYFGVGGNATTEDIKATRTVSTAGGYYQAQFSFGSNYGLAVGSGNDDYVQVLLRPASGAFNIAVTDFGLVIGTQTITTFPPMTNSMMLSRGVAGWMPTPNADGTDLYLPLILTTEGVKFDHSIVGQIVGKPQISATANQNELLMDGTSYVGSAYNATTGIPYSRLRDYLLANSPGLGINNGVSVGNSTVNAGEIPVFGTGANFVTILRNPTAGQFDLTMNTSHAANTVTLATASPTGFTFIYNVQPLWIINVGANPAASTYFTFSPNTGGGLVYNVWFKVDGVGTAPATPSGANIEVAIASGGTIAATITAILQAINKYRFLVLDARGYFWRGLDQGTSVDPNANTRVISNIKAGANSATGASLLGSLETGAYLNHSHTGSGSTTITGVVQNYAAGGGSSTYNTTGGAGNTTFPTTVTVDASTTGGAETRPINLALNWYIKY